MDCFCIGVCISALRHPLHELSVDSLSPHAHLDFGVGRGRKGLGLKEVECVCLLQCRPPKYQTTLRTWVGGQTNVIYGKVQVFSSGTV